MSTIDVEFLVRAGSMGVSSKTFERETERAAFNFGPAASELADRVQAAIEQARAHKRDALTVHATHVSKLRGANSGLVVDVPAFGLGDLAPFLRSAHALAVERECRQAEVRLLASMGYATKSAAEGYTLEPDIAISLDPDIAISLEPAHPAPAYRLLTNPEAAWTPAR